MKKPFEFCQVCRQNHNQGRQHRYATKHKHRREFLLKKIYVRIEDVRCHLKDLVPSTEKAETSNNFWCHFCAEEISEQRSIFARADIIKHLGSERHAESVRRFWAENGGDAEKLHLYVIEEKDLAAWEKAREAFLAVNGPQISSSGVSHTDMKDPISFGSSGCGGLSLASNSWKVQDETVCSNDANGKTLVVSGDKLFGPGWSPKSGAFVAQSIRQVSASSEKMLAAIGVPCLKPGEGNVHSGAPPPWLKQNSGVVDGSSSSRYPLPLSKTQERKLAKIRNPNRVGAAWAEKRRVELEREQGGEIFESSVGDVSSWFPSFGRVWQGGSRRDTRKEFEAENHSELQKQGRKGGGLVRKKLKATDLQPYISKKQRLAMEEAKEKLLSASS